MQEISLSSWDDFSSTINSIRLEYGEYKIADYNQKNNILFRGHSDCNWSLTSTLERFSTKLWSVESYLNLVLRCLPQIESFTDKNWNLPDRDKIFNDIKTKTKFLIPYIPCYDFLVYLRHHGFPSPLLDWTISPYIAAFFSFFDQSPSDNSSVFAYIEHPKGTKVGWGSSPYIGVQGPYVRTHKRHFLQQSWYTVCIKDDKDIPIFVCHEDVFKINNPDQDFLIKISMPRSDRLKALNYLNEFNINYFTLFQSEEALMKTLAFKEIELNT